jgi:uncharacterized repeat protein (TIGR01451 family)
MIRINLRSIQATTSHHDGRSAWNACAMLLIGLLLNFVAIPTARASFNNGTPRAAFAGKYDYVVTGGSLRTSSTNACSVTNSNTAALSGIPSGSTIVAAYLYWGGSGPNPDSNVSLNGSNVSADQTFTDVDDDNLSFFGGYKNVTNLVTGNGSYTFSNLAVTTSGDYCSVAVVQAGWSLVVVYSNPALTNHVINVYDGLQHFWGESITTSPSNFKVPPSSITGKMTVVTWEGDVDNSGTRNGISESLMFNGHNLGDAYNPLQNIYNSTINTPPASTTSYGVDIDTFNVGSWLSPGQTSAAVSYSSGADQVYLAAQVISTSTTDVADLSITKTHSGNFTGGSNGAYNIVVHNNGPDATTGTNTVTDTLPSGLTYVSASGSGWTCSPNGQVVTCGNATSISNGGNSPTLALTVAVSSSAPALVTNTATVDSPGFDSDLSNNSTSDPTTIVGSNPPASGNKVLYLYDSLAMNRTVQANDSEAPVNINGNGDSESWQMTPGVAAGKTLTLGAGTVSVKLVIAGTNSSTTSNRPVTVELFTSNGVSLGSTTQTVDDNDPSLYTYSLPNPQISLTAGQYLVLRVTNGVNRSSRHVAVYQKSGALYSRLSFDTPTVINVDSVNIFSVPYSANPNGTNKLSYAPGDTVYVRAVISDPFGSYDVNGATIKLADPNGAAHVLCNPPITPVADSGAATRTYECSYVLPNNAPVGNWTASVTGYEGTEGTVQHTANATLKVAGVPNLLVMKSVVVITDPTYCTAAGNPTTCSVPSGESMHSLPGAAMEYTINVSNDGSGSADTDSLIITDPVPANTQFIVGSVSFVDGSPPGASGLNLGAVNYSATGITGPWTYHPSATSGTPDPAVKALQIIPQGSLPGKSGTTAPNFNVKFRVIVQ